MKDLGTHMSRIIYVLAFCLMLGIAGCSHNDANTGNAGTDNNTAAKNNKDSLLNAASKLNAADSGKTMKKDSSHQSK